LAASTRSGWRRLFHGGLDIALHERPLDFAQARELDVSHSFALAFQHAIRIGQ
jgi:hypothetical protein